MTAIAMVMIIGFVALATDVGLLWSERRQMQTAADAAAVAGVIALRTSANVTSAAANLATLNGYTNGINGAIVTFNNPPASGPYAGNSTYVEVIIARPAPSTYFLRVLAHNPMSISTRAVSGVGSASACIYALSPTGNNAVSITGSSSVTTSCGLLDDSTASQAMTVSGGSTLTAASIGVVGNYTGSGYTPAPKTGVASVADPLAALQPPTVGACTATKYTAPNPSGTIGPGTYCNGITVQGGATLYLNPGLYILLGGGLTVGGDSSIVGTGVTFYNTGSKTYSYKAINLTGTSTTSLIAPTSGTWAGILFFQDRSIVSNDQNTVSGSSATVYQGALYFPTTPLVYSGGSSATGYTIVVAYTITFSGGSSMNSNYSSLAGGSPIKRSPLYE